MQSFTNTLSTPKTRKQKHDDHNEHCKCHPKYIESNHQKNKMVETQIGMLLGCSWVFTRDMWGST